MNNTQDVLSYYNEHAAEYMDKTCETDLLAIQNQFLTLIPEGSHILDLGCGSGRDTKYFLSKGYSVTAVDGSAELVRLSSEFVGQKIVCSTYEEYEPAKCFEGIWACASLVHLKKDEFVRILEKYANYLKPNGCFYFSVKQNQTEADGRPFSYYSMEELLRIVNQVDGLVISSYLVTEDSSRGTDVVWNNVFCKKQ